MSGADLRYSPEVRRRFLELPAAGDFSEDESTVMRASAGDVEQGARVQLAIRVSAGAVVGARFKALEPLHRFAVGERERHAGPGAS
jgi:ABC-type phosphonate transport system ATPase subunit